MIVEDVLVRPLNFLQPVEHVGDFVNALIDRAPSKLFESATQIGDEGGQAVTLNDDAGKPPRWKPHYGVVRLAVERLDLDRLHQSDGTSDRARSAVMRWPSWCQDQRVFVRFVVGSDGQHHKELTGIFTEARLLRERGLLTAEEDVRLEAAYDWFQEHVPVPPFSSGRLPRHAVAWFKHDAREPVARMWDIAAMLREHGAEVRLLRSANPGRVVYEDQLQVVVVEWNRI